MEGGEDYKVEQDREASERNESSQKPETEEDDPNSASHETPLAHSGSPDGDTEASDGGKMAEGAFERHRNNLLDGLDEVGLNQNDSLVLSGRPDEVLDDSLNKSLPVEEKHAQFVQDSKDKPDEADGEIPEEGVVAKGVQKAEEAIAAASPKTYDFSDLESGAEEAPRLFAEVANMDINGIREALAAGGNVNYTSHEYKYRTVLHELVLSYSVRIMEESTEQLKLQFIDILSLFREYGIRMNAKDYRNQTALHLAASHPYTHDIIKILITSDADVKRTDHTEQTALHLAVTHGDLDEVQVLLDGGALVNVMDCLGHSPLHLAARRRHRGRILCCLLNAYGNPNCQRSNKKGNGSTPLHVAAKACNLENVKLLLGGGANPNLYDGWGQTALHIAAANDMTGKIVDELIENGARPDVQDAVFGETPLHLAVKRNMNDVLMALIRHKARPNMKDMQQGETSLHAAARTCQAPYTWTVLMELGGDPTVRNSTGLTPMDIADRSKNTTALVIMQQYLATMKPPRSQVKSSSRQSVVIQ